MQNWSYIHVILDDQIEDSRNRRLSSEIILYRSWEDLILKLPHQQIGLFCQTESKNGVGQYPCQMGQESLVDSQKTLGLHSLCETIKDAFVQVAVLVVHSRHDGI